MHADSWQESAPETGLSAERLALFKGDHADCRADGCQVLDLLAEVERLRNGPEHTYRCAFLTRAEDAEATLAAVRTYAAAVAKGPHPPAGVAVKVLELLDGEGPQDA